MKTGHELKTFVEEVINGSGDVSEWKQKDGGDIKFINNRDEL